MRTEDFDLFAAIVKHRSGMALTRDKAYFLESRMLPIIRKYNLRSMDDLALAVRTQRNEVVMDEITEAITVNDTFFFRDYKVFMSLLMTALPQLRAARSDTKQLRIWSAATATGQEAYSFAMLLAEAAESFEDWKIEIIGTDISKTVISRAKAASYTQFEVQRGLPIQLLVKYFENAGRDKWQIKDGVRNMVQFREANLIHDFGPIGSFDFILCRNVLSSMDEATQRRVVDALHRVMALDGILMLGAGEVIAGVDDKFQSTTMRGVYAAKTAEKAA